MTTLDLSLSLLILFSVQLSAQGQERLSPAGLVPATGYETLPGLTALASSADTEEDFIAALKDGRLWLNLRYRFENVDQQGFSKDARASTLRTVLGYETGAFHGFSALLEFEDVSQIGGDDYNSTTNGKSSRPVVADPKDTDVNQAYLRYDGFEDLSFLVGRQEIVLDNQRFVGPVGWRQNHQSFDAITVKYTIGEGTLAFYSFLHQVNRIFGEDSPNGDEELTTHLFNVHHDIEDFGRLTGYVYALNFDHTETLTTTTTGLRFAGSLNATEEVDVLYTGEYAFQTDSGDNPNDVDASYFLAELGADVDGFIIRGGWEHLGGSGDRGDKFTTPFATLHKFNGFADVFLNTPDDGLEDYYLSASKNLWGAKTLVAFHIFEADEGSDDYGTELDAVATYPLTKHLTVGAKLAAFDKDDAFKDVTKVIGWLDWSL